MFNFLFKKRKYLDCPCLKHSLHFFYDEIRACCSNVKGPIFYSNVNNDTQINLDYIYNKRKEIIAGINSSKSNEAIPDECKNCYMVKDFLTDKKIKQPDNSVNCLFIQNNMSCNAKCIYCVFAYVDKGQKYDVVSIIKSLIDRNLLDKKSKLMLSGGEITISPKFEELITLLDQNLDSQIYLATSGIKYSKALENMFSRNKCWETISLDCGCSDTYMKLKRVDCFNQIVNNIKEYTNKVPTAPLSIILKYIIVDGINDNKEEIKKFFDVVNDLKVKNIIADVNFEDYSVTNNKIVPKYYFELFDYFKQLSEENNIRFEISNQTQQIINKKV